MEVIADLHVHSRFARASSSNITIRGMESTAIQKGISLLATGDFLHKQWLSEIKMNLEDEGNGLYKVKGSSSNVRFAIGGEVSTVYESKGKIRKIHHCVFVKSIEEAEQLRDILSKKGQLDSDGRPTLMMSSAELVESALSIESNSFIFPAHAWTPYFGVLGSISGFDSIDDAYEDKVSSIHALETGLSSDPEMNWRLSKLDRFTLISNSDMHSLPKMGREANVFELERLTYDGVVDTIKKKDKKRFKYTIEYYPEEGKYHYDGHRQCGYSSNPETQKSDICPICGKKLVIGVLHRVNDLADRPRGFVPNDAIPFKKVVPLAEVIANVLRKSTYSAMVSELYEKMIGLLGSEFHILLNSSIGEIAGASTPEIAKAIENMRNGNIYIEAGYDGVFGKIDLLNRHAHERTLKAESRKGNEQRRLF
ncbi:MAG: endonuclease Q family protein [Candidatus Micrarchaeia archaeon]